jgi:hypothetical protein
MHVRQWLVAVAAFNADAIFRHHASLAVVIAVASFPSTCTTDHP